MAKRRVYISGALTSSTDSGSREFYEGLAEVFSGLGWDPYVPHLVSDPIKNPGMTPDDVHALDTEQVAGSDLVLAIVDEASFGVGAELEIAREHQVPIIVVIKRQSALSRMVRGNPMVKAEIHYRDRAELVDFLRQLVAISS